MDYYTIITTALLTALTTALGVRLSLSSSATAKVNEQRFLEYWKVIENLRAIRTFQHVAVVYFKSGKELVDDDAVKILLEEASRATADLRQIVMTGDFLLSKKAVQKLEAFLGDGMPTIELEDVALDTEKGLIMTTDCLVEITKLAKKETHG
jgi:hypothetical protein